MAFDPADEAKAIAMFTGEGEDGNDACIRYQPQFNLDRDDHYYSHRVLQRLTEDNPELTALGTIVVGFQAVAEGGMGIQYVYSADSLRRMAEAYRLVTPDVLAAAIETIHVEFHPEMSAAMCASIAKNFPAIRDELSVVADKGWAMIAGMI